MLVRILRMPFSSIQKHVSAVAALILAIRREAYTVPQIRPQRPLLAEWMKGKRETQSMRPYGK